MSVLLELMNGFEPSTYALPRRCATYCATSALNNVIIQHLSRNVNSFLKIFYFNN